MKEVNVLRMNSLTEEQILFYSENGYLIVRKAFSPSEVEELKKESNRLITSDLIDRNNIRTAMYQLGSGELVVERIDPVIDVSPKIKSLLADPRILSVVADLINEEPVLFKDKLIFKLPGVRGYEMHQDYTWWQSLPSQQAMLPIHPDKILSVIVSIDAATAENGALELFPGFHHSLLTPVGELRKMDSSELAQVNKGKGIIAATEPGDIVIFHSLIPHQSGPNISDDSRRQLFVTYNATSYGDMYDSQQNRYRSFVAKILETETESGPVYFQ